jgi:hypothetical protein
MELTMATTAVIPKATRNEALDFTKGALVLLMVLYHWLNYFVVVQWDVYRYLRFLTPSFIFITGFLVVHAYVSKYSLDDPRLYFRLITRGAKLLLLFSVLNLVANLVLKENYGGTPVGVRSFIQSAYGIYVEGTSKAAFVALVPIAYFLLLSPLFLLIAKGLRVPLIWSGVVAVLLAIIADQLHVKNVNLQLISIAVLGMGLGTLPIEWINGLSAHPIRQLIAYAAYIAAISFWNILFPLQVIGVCLSVLLIYTAGVRAPSTSVRRITVQLGKYSLFGYIAHLVILQGLRFGFRRFDLSPAVVLVPFAIALVLTVAVVALVSAVRGRSGAVDRLYRVVFA